ncbi:MAG: glycoside hydrolase family 15 protein, partial [Acidobacteriota bacterium]
MAFQPIENNGNIGDQHTVALVGMNGSIDWYCTPHFDSPSIFAAILDDEKGGHFKISSRCDNVTHKQFYWPESNVLITRFISPEGVGEVKDYMPVGLSKERERQHQIVRRVQSIRGSIPFRMECAPAFDYARATHETEITKTGAVFHSNGFCLGLGTRRKIRKAGKGVVADFILKEGETAIFVLGQIEKNTDCRVLLTEEEADELANKTVEYWRRWLSQCTYHGRCREMVHRSALTLKLLTFKPTGAIVAAPTCSLPEGIGGERNWDYRYTWIRDAAFTVYGLLRIGLTESARDFMNWLQARCHELEPDGSLQIMYGIDGRHCLKEETLDHLKGYRGSRPVRIGNGAYNQVQLDIYGELMDSVYLYNKYGSPISYDLWQHLRRLINWVCDNWDRKDHGIWEVRG